jgi:DnaK suppressor protein
MNKKDLEHYKQKLLSMKQDILNNSVLAKRDDLEISSDDLPDEADVANSVVNQQITFNMRAREMAKLRNIELALQRIEDGTYGHCDECDDEIGSKRLEKQPWADLCITHAEEREREESRHRRAG